MAVEAALTALAQSFHVAVDASGAANRTFVASLVPPNRELQVTDLVTATEIVQAPIDVGWRTKDVRFQVTDITDGTVVGGMPINDLLALNVANVTAGALVPPGVPGLIGALLGTIPLPIEVTTPTQLDVAVDVRWRVTDENGDAVNEVAWSLSGSPPESGTGGVITPSLGRALDALSLVFGLVLVEHIGVDSPTVQRTLFASIRLMAGGESSDWVDLPPVPLTLPAIPVPTIAIFCLDKTFKDNRLVVVPETSPFDKNSIQDAFGTLRGIVEPLEATFSFLSLFVSQAGLVANILSASNVTFRKTNEVANLNNIDLQSGFFNDTEAEDELSSMLLIGAPRRRIECFNKRNFGTGEGQMNLTVGTELIALVSDLHSASPSSDPPGRVSVPFGPSGSRWGGVDPWSDITSFGDEFSSIRFSWG